MDENQVGEHCSYCECNDPDLLLLCNMCRNCFCNCTTEGIGSHIYHHIKSLDHTNYSYCYSSLSRSIEFHCSACNEDEITKLNYYLTESVVDVKCDECLKNRKDLVYQPILTYEKIVSTDLLDSCNSNTTSERVLQADESLFLKLFGKAPKNFSGITDYTLYFMKYELIEHEAELEEETWIRENVGVKFTIEKHRFKIEFETNIDKITKSTRLIRLEFELNNEKYSVVSMTRDLLVNNRNTIIYYEGSCHKSNLKRFCLYKEFKTYSKDNYVTCYIENIPNTTKHKRVLAAFSRFLSNNRRHMDRELKLLISSPKTVTSVPKSELKFIYKETKANLDESKLIAIKAALENKITLIQGPPGTGKTFVLAKIVEQLVQQSLFNGTSKKILVVAESNGAVINILRVLIKMKIKAIRNISFSRHLDEVKEGFTDLDDSTSILLICKELKVKVSDFGVTKLFYGNKTNNGKYYKNREDSIDEEESFIKKYKKAVKEVFDKYDVICSTCNSSGDENLSIYEFPVVIIDEAGQVTEPSMLVPLTQGCQHLVLVGDHKQLPPFVMAGCNKSNGMAVSPFERLSNFYIPILLNVQYRSHPDIARIFSKLFYEGKVKSSPSTKSLILPELGSLFKNESPCCFINHSSPERRVGTSKCNEGETEICINILRTLKHLKIRNSQIGVISPYEGQRVMIMNRLESQMSGIEIGNIDSYQGREKDIIIFSCVRSNRKKDIGFMTSKNRLNVALSRAKYALFIIGNAKNFQSMVWIRLINIFKISNTIYDDWMKQYGKFCLSKISYQKIREQPKELEVCWEIRLQELEKQRKCNFSEISTATINDIKNFEVEKLKQLLSDCIINFDNIRDLEAFKTIYTPLFQLGIIPSLPVENVISFVKISITLELTTSIELLLHFNSNSMEKISVQIIYDFLAFLQSRQMIKQNNTIMKHFKIDQNKFIEVIINQLARKKEKENLMKFIECCNNKELAVRILKEKDKSLGNILALHYNLEQDAEIGELNKIIKVKKIYYTD